MRNSDSLRAEVAELRTEMRAGFSRIDSRFEQQRVEIKAVVAERTAELLKWSFVFWVGAVGAIAALAGVLR